MKFSRFPGLLGSCALAGFLIVACATGAEDDPAADDLDSGSSIGAGTTGGGTTGTSTPANPSGNPPGKDGGATKPDAGDTATPPDGGVTGGDSGTTSPGACSQTGACPGSVVDIGVVSGDTPSPTLTKVGSGSMFLKVRVTEDDAAILSPKAINSRYTLTMPAGANYEMIFYYDESNNSASAINCTHRGETTGAEQTKVQSLTWPDAQSVGGHNDASNVTIEVRFISGTCNPGDQWQLLVEGNKP